MKFRNTLIKLVKIENSIATIFERLAILEVQNKVDSNDYKENLVILCDLLKVEDKYLRKVYEPINYFDNKFGNNPLRYVVSEYGCHNNFIDSFSEEIFYDDITDQFMESDISNKPNSIYTKFIDNVFCRKYSNGKNCDNDDFDIMGNSYDNGDTLVIDSENDNFQESNKGYNFEILEHTRSEGNLIYQRIMYGLKALEYNELTNELRDKDTTNIYDLIDICMTRDKLLLVILECEKKINDLKQNDYIKNEQFIYELTYYKYSNIFRCSLLTNDCLFKDNNYLLRNYLGYLLGNSDYISRLYNEDCDLNIDEIIYDIYNNIEGFSDENFISNYDNTFINFMIFSFILKSKLLLLNNKNDIKNYCKKIEDDIINNGYYQYSLDEYTNFIDYLKSILNSVLNDFSKDDKSLKK